MIKNIIDIISVAGKGASRIKNEWSNRQRLSAPKNNLENEFLLYGVVGSADYYSDSPDITSENVIKWLEGLPSGTTEINIRINSPGGQVFEGIAIYNALLTWKNESPLRKVTATIDSLCASIAVLVSMAANEIIIAGNGMMMIHNVTNFVFGTADDLRKEAEALDKVELTVLNTTVARTGNDPDVIQQWMNAETFFTAEEAVKYGFADRALPLNAKPENNKNEELYNLLKAANNKIRNRITA